MDDNTVQTDSTSTGDDSTQVASTGAEPTMAEQVTAAVATAMEQVMPRLRQGARDAAKSEVSRGKPEDGVSSAIREILKGRTFEDGESVEGVLVRAEETAELKRYRDQDATARSTQATIEQSQQFLVTTLRNLKIDPNNPKIDWAADEHDAEKGAARFAASVDAIIAERIKGTKPAAETEVNTDNVVDIALPKSAISGIPKNKAAVTKFYETASSEEIARLGPEIDKALFDGRIKD